MAIILEPGPAKGVPLEGLKKVFFSIGFLYKTDLLGASGIFRKSAPAASWGIGFSALQGGQSFILKAMILLFVFCVIF